MRKLSVVLAVVAVMMSTFGGVAAAIDGGNYPPRPVTITVQNPTVPVGVGFWAKAQGLCVDTPARFVLTSLTDPSLPEYWTPSVTVAANGTATYTFTPAELAPFGSGPIRVTVKQLSPTCFSKASTIVTITSKPVKSPSIDVTPTSPKIGQDLTVRAKNFCPNTKIQFILQSLSSGTKVTVDSVTDGNGNASHTFPAAVLPGGPGNYDVWAKQKVGCDLIKSVTITVTGSKSSAPVKDDEDETEDETDTDDTVKEETDTDDTVKEETDTDDTVKEETDTDDTVKGDTDKTVPKVDPESSSAQPEAAAAGPVDVTTPSTQPAAEAKITVTPAVLSTGLTAPTAAAAAAAAPASAQVASAAAVAAAPGDTLPVTGSEPSRTLQIALTALLAGIGMIIVTSVRRRTANVRSR